MPIEQHHAPLEITPQVQADLIRRALAAWHGTGEAVPPEAAREPVGARIASKRGKATECGTELRPMHFAVVHAGAVVLAVYKVRQVNDGLMLRRMVRPPKDLVRLKGSPAGGVGNGTGNEGLSK